LVRPLPWARSLPGLRFTPERWGAVLALKAPGGTHLLVRRHGAPELTLWLPARHAPRTGEPFGLYFHPDVHSADRLRAAAMLRRALGFGPPLRRLPWRDAHRQAAMLCIHDLAASGLALRDIAARLLPLWPDDWRSSSERSDFRRLAGSAAAMVAGGYRGLLAPRRPLSWSP
jgi:hypothetical protein